MATFRYGLLALLIGTNFTWAGAHAATDTYAKTRYPIILVHGMGGNDYHGTDYWYGIKDDLVAHGATVFEADLAAMDFESVRGEQLLRQLRNVLAVTGAQKVNLIGHSQGGLSSRYVAGILPEAVASITTISTPHRGSPTTDTVISKLLAKRTDRKLGDDAMQRALQMLSAQGTAAFTQQFPSAGLSSDCRTPGKDSDTIQVTDTRTMKTRTYKHLYYSWAGTKQVTNAFDFSDAAFAVGRAYFPPGEANDGLVSTCSAAFGKVISLFSWNHSDEHNQFLGMVGLSSAGKSNPSNPVVVIRTHANRLKLAGL